MLFHLLLCVCKNLKQLDDKVGRLLSQVVGMLAGMEMTFTIEQTGTIKEIKIPAIVRTSLKNIPGAEGLGDLLSDESLKKMAQGGVVLPREAVTKGKSWTEKTDMKLPLGRIKGDIQFTYEGAVDRDGKRLEKIALKPNLTLEARLTNQ